MRNILPTDDLVLRPLLHTDAPALFELGGDIRVSRMLQSHGNPFSLLSAEFMIMDFIMRQRRGLAFAYAVSRAQNTQFIGMVDLCKTHMESPFNLNIWLGRPFWKRGYARQAVQSVLQEAQHSLGANRIYANVFADNIAGLSLLRSLGFNAIGASRSAFSMARMENASVLPFAIDLNQMTCATKAHIEGETLDKLGKYRHEV